MTKKYLGKVVSFKFEYSHSIESFTGYLLAYNKEWVLLKHNTVDFIVDGYILLKNDHITHYKRDSKEKFIQKILDLKGYKPNSKEIIPLTDIGTTLAHLTKKYSVFQFDMKTNKKCWLGNLKKITGSNIKINYLMPNGRWSSTMPPFKLGNIRTVQFDTDYINSLLLIAKK